MLTRELDIQQGILDMFTYDNSIFDNVSLPEGIDRQLAIDTIICNFGHTPLYRPDPAWIKYYLGNWSRKNAYTFETLYKTITQKYDPIYNYDRYETATDNRTVKTTGKENEKTERAGTIKDSGESRTQEVQDESSSSRQQDNAMKGTSTEHVISADNVSTYQSDSKDINSGNDTLDSHITTDRNFDGDVKNTTSATQTNSDNSGRDLTHSEDTAEEVSHTVRAYGNVGVTTTQQMLQSERDVAMFNLYDVIAQSFHDEFCLYLY